MSEAIFIEKSVGAWGRSEVRERCAWLVAQGADLTLRVGQDATGPLAMHLAASIGDTDMTRSMQARGADVTASFLPQLAEDGQQTGAWECFVRRAVSCRSSDRDADIEQLVQAINWLECVGGGQAGLQVTPQLKLKSSTLLNHHNQLMGVDKAIAIINDETLSANYLAGLKCQDLRHPGQRLCHALLLGLKENATHFSRACMDAGARTDAMLDGKTVEQAARQHAEHHSWNKNTAIDDAVAYSGALVARQAIDSLDELIARTHYQPSQHAMAAVRARP